MFLSTLTGAIYAAGYDFNTVQDARRYVMDQYPPAAEEILDQPLNTAQANPAIPDELGVEILERLSIPLGVLESE